jgi:phage-related protein
MPETTVVFFAQDKGSAPALEWLDSLPEKVQNKFIVRVERLALCGYKLGPPEAKYLRDGMYELRVRHMHVNYRLLYFFCGEQAVVSHGLTKKARVPDRDIDLVVTRRQRFERDQERYTYTE